MVGEYSAPMTLLRCIMKSFTRFSLVLAISVSFNAVIHAQSIDYSQIAFELMECSIFSINASLPQDLGPMTFDRTSMSESTCDFYYTIKDDSVFSEYRNNKTQLKKNLYINIDQNLSSMESSMVFCIDANVSINYHYGNKSGNEVVIPFSVAELEDILGRDVITNSYRREVVGRLLPVAFSAAAETPMTYQGMTEKSIMYTLMMNDDGWVGEEIINQSYLENMAWNAFRYKEPGRIFPLLCLYTGKGEDLTVVNSRTGARKSGEISYNRLSNIYRSVSSVNTSSNNKSVPLPPEEEFEEETVPFQMVEFPPKFNGGNASAFSEWVNTQLVYPEEARENGVQGRVTLQFTVDTDGSIINVRVLRGVDPLLDAEAVRVVKRSPKWTPGKMQGRYVKVTYTFPVVFALQ